MKRLFILATILVLFLALAACKEEQASQDEVMEPEPTPEPEQEELDEEEGYPYYAPLTGLGSEEELTSPIFAVMINNHAQARPQSGLPKADIVYEVLSEGFITRYLALYQSERAEVIGPIRSIRPYYMDLSQGFEAYLAHAGGSEPNMNRISQEGIPSLNGIAWSSAHFYRADFRQSPHNLYTSSAGLFAAAEQRGYAIEREAFPVLKFHKQETEMEGEEAEHINIAYHSSYQVSFRYDPENEVYIRYVQGEQDLDLETGTPITVSNLMVMESNHRVLEQGIREVDVLSEGQAYLFQRGKMKEVVWKRIDGVIRAFINDQEVGLYPGKTWVNVVPNQPGLSGQVEYTSVAGLE